MAYMSILYSLGSDKTVAFAILSGVIGFFAKGLYDLWATRRKERLDRVNQQLKLLYGPLFALNQAGRTGVGSLSHSDQTRWIVLQDRSAADVFHPIHEEMLLLVTKTRICSLKAVLDYPTRELGSYLQRSFARLKAEQAKLLGRW
jgi:hypothetical protein